MSNMEYERFVRSKSQLDGRFGFEPTFMPEYLFPFQKALVKWAVEKGRGGIFADCGLGKTLMELVWAQNVYKQTGEPVLILTPLAVTGQFAKEAERFGIDAGRSVQGEIPAPITIVNYERLHLFDADMFSGVVCDESSILKSFDGIRRAEITEFMRTKKYRLLGTATAAPNDYTELGTSSEALGYLGYMDMLGRFFTNRQRTSHMYHGKYQMTNNDGWRFKGHAEQSFWRWVSSWARALRKPSDMGFDDNGFILPGLTVNQHVISTGKAAPGMLLELPAIGWREVRAERKRTIPERCAKVAELVNDTGESAVIWCSYNPEGDLLEKLIPDAEQVSGKDNDDSKERKFESFSKGDTRVLITKPKIGAWGLNWQHCNHVTYFPTDSYEQWYQAVRRVWRFGQQREVTVDVVSTPGQDRVLENMQKKEKAAGEMFTALVAHMNDSKEVERLFSYNKPVEVPSWLS
jgi:KaiC/GvpD/RAD55 family RecA-like ATPase